MRMWLNNTFYNTAFNKYEQEVICNIEINSNNYDKVSILSDEKNKSTLISIVNFMTNNNLIMQNLKGYILYCPMIQVIFGGYV